MKNLGILLMLAIGLSSVNGQEKLTTRTGKTTFISETPVENIYAESNQSASIFVVGENKIVFNVLLKSFKFEKALMEEHFNEKYVHSDTYPAAKFKGTISKDIDTEKPQIYKDVQINGSMIFHGVTKPLIVLADIEVKEDHVLSFLSTFKLKLEDYNVEIPSLVKDKIAEDIEITFAANYN